jgi:hypothetical protein
MREWFIYEVSACRDEWWDALPRAETLAANAHQLELGGGPVEVTDYTRELCDAVSAATQVIGEERVCPLLRNFRFLPLAPDPAWGSYAFVWGTSDGDTSSRCVVASTVELPWFTRREVEQKREAA